ncbi:23S rRNA (guanosine(2251)-2'-O)-methyltransferase RlmB [Patescibacteria group bacterium]|jgi:23S rRNA (guanosine2251-2'-O)-methyltransferase|nr:23S rRNA (guanosine(2251)-2'-O)-methyltransferase RlmB [Patescibacteria group bacterium]
MTYIYGIHSVTAALTHKPGSVKRVLCATKRPDIEKLAGASGIAVARFDAATPPRDVPKDAPHQGVLAEVDSRKLTMHLKDLTSELTITPDTALVVLAEVQDPHNVGAIIRSAAAFGAAGVVIPEHRQAPVTGVVVKASAGTAFSLTLVEVANVNTTLSQLADLGFWIYGLAGQGETVLYEEEFSKPSVFVVGNEGAGLREKTRERCDFLLSIPMNTRAESLNASNAAAVALSHWSRQHPGALT